MGSSHYELKDFKNLTNIFMNSTPLVTDLMNGSSQRFEVNTICNAFSIYIYNRTKNLTTIYIEN